MSKMYYPLYGCIEQKVAIVPLKISIASDASVSSFVGKGVESVTKSATGEYTVVLKDSYNKLLSAQLSVLATGIVVINPQIKSEDVAAKSVVILTHNGTAVADTEVALELQVSLVVTKSSVA